MAEKTNDTAPAKRGFFKMMLLMLPVLLLVAAAGGGGAWYFMKPQAPASDGAAPQQQAARVKAPTFLPLDSFTVNLADRDIERYAQIGITLELDDAKSVQRIKDYMPVVRDSVLMVLAHKESTDLLERAGKENLAHEIMRAVVIPLGVELDASGASTNGLPNPVREVLFSNIIVQ